MREIRLDRMRIQNFKGIRELDIQFDGKDMNICGDNGTGKTTIIDSFTWLLFGKDSLGRSDFGIKPTDKAGEIIHQLETSVEAVFNISGDEKVLKKTLTEVWTRKRGAAEAEFTRNENNFYIDGVPKKKAEFAAAIKELIDEEVFKIITNPLYFNESVNWKDRRNVLLTICGEVSDADVIASNPMLAQLIPLLKGRTVSDFKDITASTMKRVNRELDMIPVKISEAELAKPDASDLEVDYERKTALTKEIEALRIKKSDIQNGAAVSQMRQKVTLMRQALNAVGRDFHPDATPEAREIADLHRKISDCEFALHTAEQHREQLAESLTVQKINRAALSKAWDKVFAERFTDSVCPTCHRELPEDEVEERRKEFNIKKAQRLDEIEKENEEAGKLFGIIEKDMRADAERITELQVQRAELESRMEHAHNAIASLIDSKEAEFKRQREDMERQIANTEQKIRDYEGNTGAAVAEIERQIASLSGELSRIDEVIANRALLERQDERIAELKNQQRTLAAEYTAAEKHLYLAEQFIVAKVNMLNERINQKFKYAKFKLFDRQINGGINEVCEVTYGGVPYKDLNNAARVNIGLDVINTIAAHYGVTCPILIDNAESVNNLFHTVAQQIRFYVSTDKHLVFEIKED